MTTAGKLSRLRGRLARGVRKIKRIAGYDRRRREAISRLVAEHHAVTMVDDVLPEKIPAGAQAVLGYVDGEWPTYAQVKKEHPGVPVLSMAVSADYDAHGLDIEKGNAKIEEAPGWLQRQFATWAGEEWRPVLYIDKADAPALIAVCSAAGIKRGRYRLFSADWTYIPHICSPESCGATFRADATQYTNSPATGGPDLSLCSAGFFPGRR